MVMMMVWVVVARGGWREDRISTSGLTSLGSTPLVSRLPSLARGRPPRLLDSPDAAAVAGGAVLLLWYTSQVCCMGGKRAEANERMSERRRTIQWNRSVEMHLTAIDIISDSMRPRDLYTCND